MTQTLIPGSARVGEGDRIAIIDTDVHQNVYATDEEFLRRLPSRWRDYLQTYGARNIGTEKGIPPQRQMTHRLDAVDATGRVGADPLFVRQQHLDRFDLSGALLSNPAAIMMCRGGNNFPEQLAIEMCRAFNDAHHDLWLEADPRYYVAINVCLEMPDEAVKEIRRCKEGQGGDRFVSVVVEPRSEHPIGNPKYWPIFQACEDYGIPLQFHVSPGRRMTACGPVNYYFEWHVGMPLRNYTVASSLIFEGVFDRFPGLKIALIEQGWAWAAPFSWRMDASWAMLRDEVPHLQRKPSEYLTSHFWFATQPMEEPENIEDYGSLYQQFEDTFGPDRLMYSSDYPHWDFDSPYESVPTSVFPVETRRRILGENASALFAIPLREGTGVHATPAAAAGP